MIKGAKRIPLTVDSILSKISEYDIFMKYMPGKWVLNRPTFSPFRKEENPSFVIGDRGGLYFIDFGDPEKRGGCFDFVKFRFGLIDLTEVMQKIDEDFGLGISSSKNLGVYREIVSKYKQPDVIEKRYSLIQVITKKFTKEDYDYWNEYHISDSDLRANNVYSVKEVYLNRKRFPIPQSLKFGYFFEGGLWKIYTPFAKTKKKKWISNVPITTAVGLNNLDPQKNSLVTKSLKDYMVCKKIYPHTCHVQNESVAAFSGQTVQYLHENSVVIYYGGDSDAAGKKASYIITDLFGFKHINPPDRLLPDVKDFADWAKAEGLDALNNHFKDKKLF